MSAIKTLVDVIRAHGPIPTVRVSSAQARGAAKQYAYWGAARYEIRLSRDGQPINVALERANSDRRSRRLAQQDAAELARRERRVCCPEIGRLSEAAAARVLRALSASADQVAPSHGA